jgi:serine/threonine protein kinase
VRGRPVSTDPREALLQMIESRSDLDGRFHRIKRVGTSGGDGSFSLVFQANEKTTSELVALKFYHPLMRTPEHAYRWACFQREAKLVQQFKGQNDIIESLSPVSEFTISLRTGTPLSWDIQFAYYALELAAYDVASVIHLRKWDPIRNLLAFRSMCRAVQRLHDARICHRDLKPGNFLVMSDGAVKLADLGAACSVDGVTPHLLPNYPFFPGDRRYSSPEILACLHDEDASIGFKCDFFSLGAILFELFTGAILGLYAFDLQYYSDLEQIGQSIKSGHKHSTFNSLVDTIKANYPLPDLDTLGCSAPKSIRGRLNELFMSLSDIDYRTRLMDFERIFNQLNICLIILRNEREYQRWLDQKRQRAERRKQRLLERHHRDD